MPSPLITPVVFFLGSAVGSFLNVAVIRYPKDLPTGRSRCPQCRKKLKWWELIPILSFILLAGRCSRCRSFLSVQYPLVEFFYGLFAVVIFIPPAPTMEVLIISILNYLIVCLLGILFLIDLKTFTLPDLYILALTVICLVILALTPVSFFSGLIGAAVGSFFFTFLWLITKGRGIGIGDIKLMAPLGLLLGIYSTIILLLVSFIVGGAYGLWLLLTKKATLKTAVPFGPFLTATAIAFIIFPELPDLIINFILN